LEKSLKNLQNFKKSLLIKSFSKFFGVQTLFTKKGLVGVRGQSPLKKVTVSQSLIKNNQRRKPS
jgi:hypothetical protein